jgi:hypothetical protein
MFWSSESRMARSPLSNLIVRFRSAVLLWLEWILPPWRTFAYGALKKLFCEPLAAGWKLKAAMAISSGAM